ncbi:MAG: hypothetical protein J5933_00900 [Clostridia bacterium]|nr:hypothetical protein [Clostridia bacterium]
MDEKDTSRINGNDEINNDPSGDEITLDDLINGLIMNNPDEGEINPSSAVSNDPEIENLLKKYVEDDLIIGGSIFGSDDTSSVSGDVPASDKDGTSDEKGSIFSGEVFASEITDTEMEDLLDSRHRYSRESEETSQDSADTDDFSAPEEVTEEQVIDEVTAESAEEPASSEQPETEASPAAEDTAGYEQEPVEEKPRHMRFRIKSHIKNGVDMLAAAASAVAAEAEASAAESGDLSAGPEAAADAGDGFEEPVRDTDADDVPVYDEPAGSDAVQDEPVPETQSGDGFYDSPVIDLPPTEAPGDEAETGYSDQKADGPAVEEDVQDQSAAVQMPEEETPAADDFTAEEDIQDHPAAVQTPVEETPAVTVTEEEAVSVTEDVSAEEVRTQDTAEESAGPDGSEEEPEAEHEPTTEESIAEYIKRFNEQYAAREEEKPVQKEPEKYEGTGVEGTPDSPDADSFDETDINLMLALGLEDELAKTVGKDAVSKISKDMEVKASEAKKTAPDESVRFTEYVSLSQNKEIQEDYSKAYSGIVFKIIATLILAAGMFLYENLSMFGINLAGPLNIDLYPTVHYMIELQLILFVIAVTYRNFFQGLKRLFTFSPIPDSILSASGLIAIIYTLVLCIFKVTEGFNLMGFPVAIVAFLTSIYEFYNLRREILSFNIVSSKKEKYALSLKEGEDMSAERKVFKDYIDEYSTAADLEKASFIDGFMARSEKEPQYGTRITAGLLIPVAVALILFLVGILQGNNWSGALSGSIAAFMFCLPATMLFTYSVPFYSASKKAYANDGAIIGEDVLEEFATTAIVTLDDYEVFRQDGVKIRSMKMFGDNRIDKVIYSTASLFNGLGGLLGEVFRVAAGEIGYSDNVEYEEILEDGIKARVDGEVHYIGSKRYIESQGIEIKEEDEGVTLYDDENYSVMYLATEKSLAAKMYLSYSPEDSFGEFVSELDSAGVCLAVNSTDPNITEEMLRSKMPENRYPVKVIRRIVKKDDDSEKHVNSGIVASGSPRSLISSVLLCDKVRQMIGTGTAVKFVAALIGAAISAFLVISGNSGIVTSAYAGIYQLLWYLPMLVLTKMSL